MRALLQISRSAGRSDAERRLLPLIDQKMEVVVELSALLARRGVAERLLVAGEGDIRARLPGLSRQLAVAVRIHWLGDVPDSTPLL